MQRHPDWRYFHCQFLRSKLFWNDHFRILLLEVRIPRFWRLWPTVQSFWVLMNNGLRCNFYSNFTKLWIKVHENRTKNNFSRMTSFTMGQNHDFLDNFFPKLLFFAEKWLKSSYLHDLIESRCIVGWVFLDMQKAFHLTQLIIRLYWPFCLPVKVTKFIGLDTHLFLSPMNLVTFAGTQNGQLENLKFAGFW